MGAGSGGARCISINTGRLHVQIDVLDATPVGTRLAKHRTEQVQRALRLQVQFGDNGLLIARRGLVRDLEDMLDLIDLRGLPIRTFRLGRCPAAAEEARSRFRPEIYR